MLNFLIALNKSQYTYWIT